MRKQSASTHTIEMKSMPITIPRTRSKFGCLPPSDGLLDVVFGACLWGDFKGEAEKLGAVLRYKDMCYYT